MQRNEVNRVMDGQKRFRKVPLAEAVGMVLAHDITEIRPGEVKCRAYARGHIVGPTDMDHLRRLGKEQLFILDIGSDELHEDDAARVMATALMGSGTAAEGAPREGKINILAKTDGLLKVNQEALLRINLLGEVMCATLHDNTLVRQGTVVAGTRAIPLVVGKKVVEAAVAVTEQFGKVVSVKTLRRPRAGVVITGNEVYYGRIRDAFEPVIRKKVEECRGQIVGVRFTPDDESAIRGAMEELLAADADLLIVTGGMSVDPDDVTRFAIGSLGAAGMTYGSAVLPGAMLLVAYLPPANGHREPIPVLGIPACGIYHRTTVFDLVLPRVLAGEFIGREELARLGHGGMCLNCPDCRYPLCPFGKN
jgi:hypothetical protein